MGCHAGSSQALQQFDKQLQDLAAELIESAEFKGKQVSCAVLRMLTFTNIAPLHTSHLTCTCSIIQRV